MLLVGIANCIVKCKEPIIVRLPKIQRVPIQPVVTGFGLSEGNDRMDWYEAYTGGRVGFERAAQLRRGT